VSKQYSQARQSLFYVTYKTNATIQEQRSALPFARTARPCVGRARTSRQTPKHRDWRVAKSRVRSAAAAAAALTSAIFPSRAAVVSCKDTSLHSSVGFPQNIDGTVWGMMHASATESSNGTASTAENVVSHKMHAHEEQSNKGEPLDGPRCAVLPGPRLRWFRPAWRRVVGYWVFGSASLCVALLCAVYV
jgi:hypothetical protein